MREGQAPSLWPKVSGYAFAVSGVVAVTAALAPFHERLSSTTVALALLLIVLFAATGWGGRPALLAALLGVVCFNFFFLPPVYTFTIEDPQNWVALAAFLITALTAGELSARAKRRAEEAEAGRREIERLYNEYRVAAERARQAEVLEQSERLKSALLDAVTHDLRTPLTSIKAAVTTLLNEAGAGEQVKLDDEARREFFEVINEEADRLNHFVENMVELARIEAGAVSLRRRWSSVEEIVAMARARADALTRGRRLEVELESELPVARVDASLIAWEADSDRRAYELFILRLRLLYGHSSSIPVIGNLFKRSRTFMKWLEIKEAVERSGISEDDEILEIHCELRDGDKALHPSKQGDFLTLSEYLSKEAQRKEIVGSAL